MLETKIVTIEQLDVDVKIITDGKKVRFWLNSKTGSVPSLSTPFSTPLKKRRDGKLFYCYFHCDFYYDKGVEIRVYEDGEVVST